MTVSFDDRLIASIAETLSKIFPAGQNHLLVVGRADRLGSNMKEPVYIPAADGTLWEGSTPAWANVLSTHLRAVGKTLPAHTHLAGPQGPDHKQSE